MKYKNSSIFPDQILATPGKKCYNLPLLRTANASTNAVRLKEKYGKESNW